MYRILYVDDEPGLLEIGKIFLEKDRIFAVDTLTSAAAALERLASAPYDAIVADYMMPGMDGISFLKQLRSCGNTTPLIIFTGRGREAVVVEALNSGADFYLQKGGEPTAQFAELAHKIRHAIERRRADLALLKSERDYRHLIETASEGIYVTQDRLVRMVNPMAVALSGYQEQELIGQPFVTFVHPDDRALLLERYEQRIAGGDIPSRYRFRVLRKDRAIRWVALNAVAIAWDGRPATLNFITDIHEHKLAEDALKKSEERYRQFFKTTRDAVFITTPDGHWIDFNDALVELFGYAGRDEVNAISVTSVYEHPGDRDTFLDHVKQHGYVKEYPVRLRRRDGTVFDGLITIVPQKNPDGSVKEFIGTLRDITEQKRIGDALRESEERYRSFFRTTLDGVFITDAQGWFIDFNDAVMANLHTTDREQVFDTNVLQIYADERERDAYLAILKREGSAREYPIRFRRFDGTVFDALATVIVQKNPDGSVRSYTGTVRDVSDRERTGNALKESEERYHLFFRTTLDSVFITAPDGRFIDFNDAMMQHMGAKSRDEVFAASAADLYADPDERALFLEKVRQAGFIREYPLRFRRLDGSVVNSLITIVIQKNPDGSVKSYIGTVRDLTDSPQEIPYR
ncbi:MAG TPA: PAS domain S-box protein [Methanoregulaceae archaeon]|nr:PAS domain S-box protein [Methanoregulaceae archaeon]